MFETFLLLLLGWSRGGRKKSLSEKGETRQSVESKRERERERREKKRDSIETENIFIWEGKKKSANNEKNVRRIYIKFNSVFLTMSLYKAINEAFSCSDMFLIVSLFNSR